MNYDQEFSGFEWTDVQVGESDYSLISEQESTVDDQFHLFETTNNAAVGSEIMRPKIVADNLRVAELTPANAREYGFNQYLGDVTTKPIQHKAIPRTSQAVHTEYMSSENADLKGRSVSVTDDQGSKLERKREADRKYRRRLNDDKKKKEEELDTLRKENAALKRLQKLGLKPGGDHQENDSEQDCKMEFTLDCYDEKSRAEAMKIVGRVSGMKRICMDVEENKLTLHGKAIDTLSLQTVLKKVCKANLLSYSVEAKIDHEKNEGKIMVEQDCMVVARNAKLVAQNSVPMTCTTPYSYAFPHMASAYPNAGPPEQSFYLTKPAFVFFLVFLIILLGFACGFLYFQ